MITTKLSGAARRLNLTQLGKPAAILALALASITPALAQTPASSDYFKTTTTGTAYAGLTNDESVAIGSGTATGGSSVAIGSSALAEGAASIALGASTNATGDLTIAIGDEATASGEYSIANGYTSQATGANAVAIGYKASATTNSVAIGANTTAAESAVALGQSASAATKSVVIGNNARASSNSSIGNVVLGASSQDRDFVDTATGAYFGVAKGVVSVGSASNYRQVTYVAAGQVNNLSTDAINGSQLYATNTTVDALNTYVDQLNTTVANLHNYDYQFTTTDADTGAGFAYVAPAAEKAGALVGGTATASNAVAIGFASYSSEFFTVALGSSATASTPNSVALGANSVADSPGTDRTTGAIADIVVHYAGSGEDHGVVSVGGTGAERQITNVAAGDIAELSTDAINGSQLYATNTTLAATRNTATSIAGILGSGTLDTNGLLTSATFINSTTTVADALKSITDANAILSDTIGALATGSAGILHYDNTTGDITIDPEFTGTLLDISASGTARTLAGLAPGAINDTSAEAINGAQLHATGTSILDILGVAGDIDNDGLITSGTFVTGGTTVNQALTNINTDLTTIAADVTNLATTVTQVSDTTNLLATGSAGILRYDHATGDITIAPEFTGALLDISASGTARTLTGLAPGAINDTSRDAINGSQLHATGSAIANSLGAGAAYTDGAFTAPAFVYNGGTYNNVGDLIANIDTSIKNTYAGDTLLAQTVYNLATGGTGIWRYDNATGSIAIAPEITGATLDISGPAGDRVISGVAPGIADNDAVNIAQLRDAGLVTGTGADTAIGNVAIYDDNTKTQVTLAGATSTDGGVTDGTKITNLAQGALDALSTDAVTGSQLFDTNQRVANLEKTTSGIANLGALAHFSTGADDPDGALPATATGGEAVAAGMGATASAPQSSALGDYAAATAPQTAAIGYRAAANAANATAIGSNATVLANATNATALGANATAAEANATAIGSGATVLAGATGAVALGANSLATEPDTVSFGNTATGYTRRLTNITAGRDLTDAVNVGQLNDLRADVANNFTRVDTAINNLGARLDSVGAMTAAMGQAQLRLSPQENRSEIALGVGGYRGHGAFAMNYGYTSRRGDRGVQAGFALSDRGDVMGGAGAVFGW